MILTIYIVLFIDTFPEFYFSIFKKSRQRHQKHTKLKEVLRLVCRGLLTFLL